MITFENVTKQYEDGTKAVDSIGFSIKKGEFFILIGPSGCGKTTTLKMINRLIDMTEGKILLNGKEIKHYDIHELRWNIGYVLQQISLFPHMTIEENIAVVPELKKWDKKKTRKRVDELLEMVGLEPSQYRHKKPLELSGGQQQRIGVARALAADPELILMDEPFSALDPLSREKLQDDMLELQHTIQKTIVFVTHDMNEALKLGDRICVMKDGQIIQIGTPKEIVKFPSNQFIRDFVGIQNDYSSQPSIADFMQKMDGGCETGMPLSISADSSLEDMYTLLMKHESIGVEQDGRLIGTISRKDIIHHLAVEQQEGGARHA
ncbi:ABC transporter ATP-binding protein [Bacillus sp. 1P06AnD]|uniref:ABC transporter ATP-binding protein n=1 Tax=Bacillus sp. 1P06AnD TaxID=3132208 RepID=UPI0039A2B205